MKLKSLLALGALLLSSSAFAVTRQFTISRAVMCGKVQLDPGTYRVRVRNGSAQFTNMNHFVNKRPISVGANIERGGERFRRTSVRVNEKGGAMPQVTGIDLSNTRTSLTFH